jgi:uncharacterized membrane protein YkoI
MRVRNLLLITSIATAGIPVAMTSFATEKSEKSEKTVKLEDIPAPARETLLREAKGAKLERVEKEKEKGKTVYEGIVKQGNEEIGIVVDAHGTLLGKHSETQEKGEH